MVSCLSATFSAAVTDNGWQLSQGFLLLSERFWREWSKLAYLLKLEYWWCVYNVLSHSESVCIDTKYFYNCYSRTKRNSKNQRDESATLLLYGDLAPTRAGWPKILGRSGRPPATILLKKTSLNDLSYGKKSGQIFLPFCHNARVW